MAESLFDEINRKSAGEKSKEEILRETPFVKLHNELINEATSKERQKELKEEMNNRAKEMEELNLVKWSDIRMGIMNKIKTSEWDDIYHELMTFAKNQEQEVKGVGVDLPNRDRYDGVVRTAIEMAALEVSTQGMERRRGEPSFKEWVIRHGKTVDELKDDKEIIERGRIFNFEGVDLPDLVGENIEKKRERDYRRVKYGEREYRKGAEKKEYPKTPEGWVKYVFERIDEAEKLAERDYSIVARNQRADFKVWQEIDEAIKNIPERMGREGRVINMDVDESINLSLSDYLYQQYPEGVYLKEQLEIYNNARRRLNERFVESIRSGGSLTQLGLGKEETPFPGIAVTLENIRPIDWWVLVHGDRIFSKEEGGYVSKSKENKEVVFDMDESLSVWWKYAADYSKNEDKKLKTGGLSYQDILNDARHQAAARKGIIDRLDSKSRKAEQLAHRMLTVALTFSLMDRARDGLGGKSEDRDVMHFDRKRVGDFGAKEREPGVDWTIGRYFAVPGQDRVVKFPDNPKMEKRKRLLAINEERAVFEMDEHVYDSGELIGDFFNIAIPVEDRDKDGRLIIVVGKKKDDEKKKRMVYRKLASWPTRLYEDGVEIHKGGWKEIPFYRMNEVQYSGYIGYNMNIAMIISGEVGKEGHKIEEIAEISFWESKKALFERLAAISPWLNSLEFDCRSAYLREVVDRVGKDKKLDVSDKTIIEIQSFEDLDENKDGLTNEQIKIIKAIKQALSEKVEKSSLLTPKEKRDRKKDERQLFGDDEKIWEGSDRTLGDWINIIGSVRADRIKKYQLQKMRMVYAMGVLWQGSLDREEVKAKGFTGSRFPMAGKGSRPWNKPGQYPGVKDIIKAIEDAEFLTDEEFVEQLRYEAYDEMGFGAAIVTPLKKR